MLGDWARRGLSHSLALLIRYRASLRERPTQHVLTRIERFSSNGLGMQCVPMKNCVLGHCSQRAARRFRHGNDYVIAVEPM